MHFCTRVECARRASGGTLGMGVTAMETRPVPRAILPYRLGWRSDIPCRTLGGAWIMFETVLQ
jgi:hypothetical protein